MIVRSWCGTQGQMSHEGCGFLAVQCVVAQIAVFGAACLCGTCCVLMNFMRSVLRPLRGCRILPLLFHGLRRGLHSFGASRLGATLGLGEFDGYPTFGRTMSKRCVVRVYWMPPMRPIRSRELRSSLPSFRFASSTWMETISPITRLLLCGEGEKSRI